MKLKLIKASKSITSEELQNIEAELGIQLPVAIKEHYLKFNGGHIKNSIIHKAGYNIEYVRFIPILYSGDFINDPDFCIPARTIREWENKIIPRNLFSFAFVSCGYLCIDYKTGEIYYYKKVGKKEMVLIAVSFDDLLKIIEIKEPELPEIILLHSFWQGITKAWAGFTSTKKFHIPYFETEDVKVFLGKEYDNDFSKIEQPPTKAELDDYEKTFVSFMQNFDEIINDIKIKTFEYYQKYYAPYYENEVKYRQEPLGVDTPEKHFEALKNINYIRICKDAVIHIPIFYGIDTEHRMEIKFKQNNIVGIGGIGEV